MSLSTIDEIIDMAKQIKGKIDMMAGFGVPVDDMSRAFNEFLRRSLILKTTVKRETELKPAIDKMSKNEKTILSLIIKHTGLADTAVIEKMQALIDDTQNMITPFGALLVLSDKLKVPIPVNLLK